MYSTVNMIIIIVKECLLFRINYVVTKHFQPSVVLRLCCRDQFSFTLHILASTNLSYLLYLSSYPYSFVVRKYFNLTFTNL